MQSTPRRLFTFSSTTTHNTMHFDSPSRQIYSTTPVSQESRNILLSPKKAPRSISKVPFKVLDAPELRVCVWLWMDLAKCHSVCMQCWLMSDKLFSIHLVGRLLLEPGRLVFKERVGGWPWKLRLPMECLDKQSHSAVRPWNARQCHFD